MESEIEFEPWPSSGLRQASPHGGAVARSKIKAHLFTAGDTVKMMNFCSNVSATALQHMSAFWETRRSIANLHKFIIYESITEILGLINAAIVRGAINRNIYFPM